MIKPESLSLSELPWVPLDATAGFPAQPGIYFAIDSQGVVQYVGISGDVRGRWKQHHRYKRLAQMGGVKIAYLFIDAPELLPDIEDALIEWFNPPLNVARPSRGPKNTAKKTPPKVNVYLDPALKLKVEALAKKDRRSLSNFIEMLCEKEVERREEESK